MSQRTVVRRQGLKDHTHAPTLEAIPRSLPISEARYSQISLQWTKLLHSCGQGLEDHAHPPTLEALPRSLPIVAAPGAAAKCRQMGYTNVTELDHGQTVSVADGRLTLSGTQGVFQTNYNIFMLLDCIHYGCCRYVRSVRFSPRSWYISNTTRR